MARELSGPQIGRRGRPLGGLKVIEHHVANAPLADVLRAASAGSVGLLISGAADDEFRPLAWRKRYAGVTPTEDLRGLSSGCSDLKRALPLRDGEVTAKGADYIR